MTLTARLLPLLAVIFLAGACSHRPSSSPIPDRGREPARADPSPSTPLLQPSPNHLVGRILAFDAARGFAIVDLANGAPAAAMVDGAELIARTDDLRETARLRVSRYLRGHTLGATLVSGQPSPGDEVVFHRP